MPRLRIWKTSSGLVSGVMLFVVTGVVRNELVGSGGVVGLLIFLVSAVAIVASPILAVVLLTHGVAGIRRGSAQSDNRRGVSIFISLGAVNGLLFAAYVTMFVVFAPPALGPSPFGARAECMNNLRQIDAAKEQAKLEMKWTNGQFVANGDSNVNNYIKGVAGTTNTPSCPSGGEYSYNAVGTTPTCSMGMQGVIVPRKVHFGLFWWRYEPDLSSHTLPTP